MILFRSYREPGISLCMYTDPSLSVTVLIPFYSTSLSYWLVLCEDRFSRYASWLYFVRQFLYGMLFFETIVIWFRCLILAAICDIGAGDRL